MIRYGILRQNEERQRYQVPSPLHLVSQIFIYLKMADYSRNLSLIPCIKVDRNHITKLVQVVVLIS